MHYCFQCVLYAACDTGKLPVWMINKLSQIMAPKVTQTAQIFLFREYTRQFWLGRPLSWYISCLHVSPTKTRLWSHLLLWFHFAYTHQSRDVFNFLVNFDFLNCNIHFGGTINVPKVPLIKSHAINQFVLKVWYCMCILVCAESAVKSRSFDWIVLSVVDNGEAAKGMSQLHRVEGKARPGGEAMALPRAEHAAASQPGWHRQVGADVVAGARRTTHHRGRGDLWRRRWRRRLVRPPPRVSRAADPSDQRRLCGGGDRGCAGCGPWASDPRHSRGGRSQLTATT